MRVSILQAEFILDISTVVAVGILGWALFEAVMLPTVVGSRSLQESRTESLGQILHQRNVLRDPKKEFKTRTLI